MNAVRVDGRGRVWVGTAAGLARAHRSGDVVAVPLRGTAGDEAPEVMDILEDAGGRLWLTTASDGLYSFDPETGAARRFAAPEREDGTPVTLRRMVGDGAGRIYLGTENGGLQLFDPAQERWTRHLPDPWDETTLSSSSIWALHRDDQGILWIGTFNGGVNLVSPLGQRFRSIRPRRGGLSNPFVSALLEGQGGELWIGTDGGGLNRLDRKTGRFTYYDERTLGSAAVLSLLQDRSGLAVDRHLGRRSRAPRPAQRAQHALPSRCPRPDDALDRQHLGHRRDAKRRAAARRAGRRRSLRSPHRQGETPLVALPGRRRGALLLGAPGQPRQLLARPQQRCPVGGDGLGPRQDLPRAPRRRAGPRPVRGVRPRRGPPRQRLGSDGVGRAGRLQERGRLAAPLRHRERIARRLRRLDPRGHERRSLAGDEPRPVPLRRRQRRPREPAHPVLRRARRSAGIRVLPRNPLALPGRRDAASGGTAASTPSSRRRSPSTPRALPSC